MSLQRLPPRKTLYEQAYLTLRSAILAGEIDIQERLIETQLAERFQMSRTPIREAIRRLQQEKLLTSDSNGGIYVTKPALHDAIKLYDCRIALEQLAVMGACEHATNAQLQDLEQIVVQSANLEKQTEENRKNRLLDLNFRFHRLIAQSSDNPWLVPLLEQLSSQTRLLRIQTLSDTPDVIKIHAEHCQIYEAIANRDAETAVQSITVHLKASQQRITHIFQQYELTVPSQTEALLPIQCPHCQSEAVNRNGRRGSNQNHKQNYVCRNCGRQFLSTYENHRYSPEMREHCIALHRNGSGFREIERMTGVNHNTVIRWVKAAQS
ncbi:MAG: FCD domain-containing protein [Cyanobacteria bacterium RM1_2_2]|nr:FCD domain-containing protein [Cyanobacteria bacterium RM1_2_2]